jgi:uncharacterized LabA/DUF88 family protein
MEQTILFIDGENFVYKIEEVLKRKSIKKESVDITSLDFNKLFELPLKDFKITRKIFYSAKLNFYPETKDKSNELIKNQRRLKNNLIKQGFEFITAGNVRGQKITVDHKTKNIFREKGVDVRLAVDLVTLACDKLLKTAILCSSDSDLQPAVKEAKNRNIEVVYLGFEVNPNKGLTYTTNRTILFRDSEILTVCVKK